MLEIVKIIIGVVFLVIGIPLGDFLARQTKEELKQGRIWFVQIISVSLVIGFIGLILGNDFLMFGLFFVAIVTSRSL